MILENESLLEVILAEYSLKTNRVSSRSVNPECEVCVMKSHRAAVITGTGALSFGGQSAQSMAKQIIHKLAPVSRACLGRFKEVKRRFLKAERSDG